MNGAWYMVIDVYSTPDSVQEREIKERVVVVIDSLRMTSTVITAIHNGCREVVPVAEVDEAVELVRKLGHTDVLLCGERNAQRISGFDLSNSPVQYRREIVEGRVLVMTTTNGTRALLRVKEAKKLYLGGFLNARPIAMCLANENVDVTIVCAGTVGRFCMEDTFATGCIIDRLLQISSQQIILDDLAQASLFLYRCNEDHLFESLRGTRHFDTLLRMGLEEDLRYCLQTDAVDEIPVYINGVIRAQS